MVYLLKATIIITIFYCCYIVLLKNETFFQQNRWFLLLGLITSALLPLIEIPIEIPVEPTNYTFNFVPEDTTVPSNNSVTGVSDFNWPKVLFLTYVIGFILFLIRFILQFGSLAILLLKNPRLKDGWYTYVIVNTQISPFSFFKWIVYNPDVLNSEEADLMLTHERVHVNQWHSIDVVLTQLACTFFWFNPLIWFYRSAIKQNLEFIADSLTQSQVKDAKAYQKLLLKTSVNNQQLILTNNFYNSLIKKRILMLQQSRSSTKNQWRYTLILPLLAVVLMSMNTKEVYVEQPAVHQISSVVANETDKKIIEVIFTRDMSQEDLERIQKELKSNEIDMTVKQLERNETNIITAIDIDFSTKNGSANYNVKDDNGIPSFYFRLVDSGGISVGAVDKHHSHKSSVIIKDLGEDRNESSDTNVFVYRKNDTVDVIISDSADIQSDVIKEHIVIGKHQPNKITWKGTDSVYIVKGYRADSDANQTKTRVFIQGKDTIRVEKVEQDLFFTEPQSGVNIKGYTLKNSDAMPIIIVNGKAMSYAAINKIDPNSIDSVTVLKGNNATELYGYKAKDGAVIIKTKPNSKEKASSKWVIGRTEVNSLRFIDDEDVEKNATLAYITKFTPDRILDKNKALLEKVGITVKYSKIKRNKAGEITSIKIKIKNNTGDESSASWKNDDGISGIEYGISEGSLVARTSTMNILTD